MDVGTALRYYRNLSKMTQNQVAEKADINEKYYGEIERNVSSPTVNYLEKICRAIGVDMGQVISFKPSQETRVERQNHSPCCIGGENTYYCNCCGTDFSSDREAAFCPQCGCEYNEENDFIEKLF